MSISNNDILTKLHDILSANNSVGGDYDISKNLNGRVKAIYKGVEGMHEEFPIMKTLLPCVFLEVANKQEVFGQLGNSAKRNMELSYTIVPYTSHGIGTGAEGEARENASKEIIQLTDNIERLMRQNVNLSGTVQRCHVTSTDYRSTVRESVYTCQSVIRLQILKYSD